MSKYLIELNNLALGGLAPSYYNETYPSVGNKNQAGVMTDVDCTNSGYISQGQGLVALTAGTQAGAVTTLIQHISDCVLAYTTQEVTFGVGGNLFYEIGSTAVSVKASAPVLPHVIDKATVTGETGSCVVRYGANIYYSYNHSGSQGDIGKYDLTRDNDNDFDDDWWTATASGTVLTSNPHQMIVGGNDVMYIANGRYVANYDGSTVNDKALDLLPNTVVQSIAWLNDRLYILTTRNEYVTNGTGRVEGSIYIWDGSATTWETEIKLSGRCRGCYVKNGILYVFYEEIGIQKLGYVNGNQIIELACWSGSLPEFYQITTYKGFLIWCSGLKIYAWGSGDKDLPTRLFQMTDAGFSTLTGAMASPFGTPIVASYETTSYQLAEFSGLGG
jgi:hypothetical protein